MKINYGGKRHEVFLCDDGTMDTVIKVDGKEYRFDWEMTVFHRKRNGEMTERGLRDLARQVLDDYIPEDES